MLGAFVRSKFAVLWLTVLLSPVSLAIRDAAAVQSEKRVALVIGNSAYQAAPALDNPTTDAHAMAAALKRLGFTVVEGYDLNINEMRAKVREYSEQLSDAGAALLYYAGHGIAMDDDNFLLPTDIVLKGPADLDLNALNVSTVLRQMQREERVNVVILDACRDNPFAKELSRTAKRSSVVDRGLSSIDASLAKGTLIAFATDPRNTALDGRPGGNSPFTTALLKHIETPGVTIGTVMDRVRADVFEATSKKQTPWVNTSIIGEFMLNPVRAEQTVATAALQPSTTSGVPIADRMALENRMWDSAERGNQIEDYQAYLDSYPNGVYAQMAKSRVTRLRGTPAAVAAVTPDAQGASTPAVPKVDMAKLKAEIGTTQTEKALALDVKAKKELQKRLDLIGFAPGNQAGTFNDKTRSAIGAWQKSHDIPQTTYLGPTQFTALMEESESFYQRFLNAQPMIPDRSMRPAPGPHVANRVQAGRKNTNSNAHGKSVSAAASAFIGGVVGGVLGSVLRGR